MKERYQKSVLVFSAVVTVFVMVSSAVGVQLSSEKSVSKENDKLIDTGFDGPFVDSQVKIRSSYLPWLKQAVENVKDEENRVFLSRIIDDVKREGVLDSEDIKDILIDLDMVSSEVRAGGLIIETNTFDEGANFASIVSIPGQFWANLWFYLGPSAFIHWDTGDESVKGGTTIRSINGPHTGIALGFLGILMDRTRYRGYGDLAEFDYHKINIFGLSLFIFINYK